MFLSRLFLNTMDRTARYDLARPYEMHRTICTQGFGTLRKEDLGRILFRVDTDRHGSKPMLIVQSEDKPDWSVMPSGYLSRPAEWKEFTPQFTDGQRLQFRLRANPTKRVAAKNERLGSVMEGKRVGLSTEVEQIRWLLRKAELGGFRIPGQWVNILNQDTGKETEQPNFRVDARPEGRIHNSKPGYQGNFHVILFDGVLEVTDPSRFAVTLSQGVGSAKGFGFGLLSVARVNA
jgi:CRISPR system Cascade subunit CasE